MKLLEFGWNVKFLGDSVPSIDMIAHDRDIGARTIQVKARRDNVGAIDLGPVSSFSADFLIIVEGAMSASASAYVYPKAEVVSAPRTPVATVEGHPFGIDAGPKKSTGKIHVWTHPRNHPLETRHDAWDLLRMPIN